MMIHGTAYFVSKSSAVRYYRSQGFGSRVEVEAIVERKLADGEIHVGKPDVPEGMTLVILDHGCRYGLYERHSK
jgi:hypothetical protein